MVANFFPPGSQANEIVKSVIYRRSDASYFVTVHLLALDEGFGSDVRFPLLLTVLVRLYTRNHGHSSIQAAAWL